MGINFNVYMDVRTYAKVEGEYQNIIATKKFVVHTYDDLQNLLLTLIESSDDSLTVKIAKEEVED